MWQQTSMQDKYLTPEDAEMAFYDAMERGDLDAMKRVWSDDDGVVCIHPGAVRLEGRADVVESFSLMFKDSPPMDFSITDARCQLINDVAVHMVREEIEIDGQLVSIMVSTNIYHRVNGSWRMMLHHASHEPDGEFDELDYTLDDEIPIVLH